MNLDQGQLGRIAANFQVLGAYFPMPEDCKDVRAGKGREVFRPVSMFSWRRGFDHRQTALPEIVHYGRSKSLLFVVVRCRLDVYVLKRAREIKNRVGIVRFHELLDEDKITPDLLSTE
jgi:hypothetical protein